MMNNCNKTRLFACLLLLFSFQLFFTSCKKDDPDPVDQRINELTATWKVNTVENDNVDVTQQYEGFTLTISGQNYTTTNGENPWPSAGTYEITAEDLSTIRRSDGTNITIDNITGDELILSFNFNTLASGRAKGVTGNFTFSLTR
ncbi:MAG: hypothetical protein KDC93_00805 [Cyclobacteriaceae bacterium]|nr:hypothetical protein [Cyclobacteriaceae bacterium]